MTTVTAIRSLEPESWTRELMGAGLPFRFSQRADAIAACDRAYPEYRGQLLEVAFSDGALTLFPGVIAKRRLPALSTFLALPLGLEGTPIPIRGEVTSAHIERFFRSMGGVGALVISGGAGGSPPIVGQVSVSSTHVLDLSPGFEVLWRERFTGKNRNACRKAEKGGVAIRRVDPPSGVELYYGVYARATRDWGYPEPPYPRALFQALGESPHVEFWLAFSEERVVSGAVLLMGSEDVAYWSGAMDRDYAGLSSSNLVLKVAIESVCGRGFRSMDFGASDRLPGVRTFKKSFGAEPRPFRSVRLRSFGNRVAEALSSTLRRLR